MQIISKLSPEAVEVVTRWNELAALHSLTRVYRMNQQRCSWLRARLRENTFAQVMHVIESVFESDFLMGSAGWQATFEWVIRPNNFDKVLEGNYLNREPTILPKPSFEELFSDAFREESGDDVRPTAIEQLSAPIEAGKGDA